MNDAVLNLISVMIVMFESCIKHPLFGARLCAHMVNHGHVCWHVVPSHVIYNNRNTMRYLVTPVVSTLNYIVYFLALLFIYHVRDQERCIGMWIPPKYM